MAQVRLSGYPEAVLGQSRISLELPASALAGDAVRAVAVYHPRLGQAQLGEDGRARRSTKVLIDGKVVGHAARVPEGTPVTVLAALPCDG